jgi:hypothetical protein
MKIKELSCTNENENEEIDKDIIISKMETQINNMKDEIVSLKGIQNTNGIVQSHNRITHSNNNTFNLQFFLNETCKDAMNITEFAESIEVGIKELKNLGKKGYVEAISSLIIDNLNKLDITKRPMHCSDVKRDNTYIKTNNVWEKENEDKKKTQKLILEVQRANTRALQDKYQEKYPQCMSDYNSKEHIEYGEIAYQAFGGKGDCDELNKKIIRRIRKEISINKSQIPNQKEE